MNPLKVVSLFDGIGGFTLAFQRAGMQIVAVVEIDDKARSVTTRHFPDVPQFADVREVGAHNLPACDVVCGGFPCQDLSVAGKRLGFMGERSSLFFEMVRIVNELRPAFLVWENVPGLLSSNNGRDFTAVLMALDGIGYHGAWTMLDAQFFGVAQRRRRVFGVFARADIGAGCCAEILSLTNRSAGNFETSAGTGQIVAAPVVSRTGKGGFTDPVNDNIIAPTLTAPDPNAKPVNGKRQDGSRTDKIPVVLANAITASMGHHGHSSPRGDGSDNLVTNAFNGYTGGADDNDAQANHMVFQPRYFTRDNKTGGAPSDLADITNTAKAGDSAPVVAWEMSHASEAVRESGDRAPAKQARMGTGGNQVPLVGVRRLTPLECERLQGFPDGWTDGQADSTRYRQLGNAVAVPVVEWIGRNLVRVSAFQQSFAADRRSCLNRS